ncbi:MAG TPA: hypothetical protein VGF44_14900 [Terriglobales bacterium]|jgi:hypothetical protein
MADSLYLSLWFPRLEFEDLLKHAIAVMRQFPFSQPQPGITYVSLHPVSWNEATIVEQRFQPPVPPEEAANLAAEQFHEDYAYVFEAAWDLWNPLETGAEWTLQPSTVRFIARGPDFDESSYEQEGHVEVDFGSDMPFLQEQVRFTQGTESKILANVQKLVEFSAKIEKNSEASARLLWSESEENLAQKLIARLQKVQ